MKDETTFFTIAGAPPPVPAWFMQRSVTMRVRDRLRVLFGAKVTVAFESRDGQCNAACDVLYRVGTQEQWR